MNGNIAAEIPFTEDMAKFQQDVKLFFGRLLDDRVTGLRDFASQDKKGHRQPSLRLLPESMTRDDAVSVGLNVLVGILERLASADYARPARLAVPGAGGNDKWFSPALLGLVRDADGNWLRQPWHPDDFWAFGRPPRLLASAGDTEADTLRARATAAPPADNVADTTGGTPQAQEGPGEPPPTASPEGDITGTTVTDPAETVETKPQSKPSTSSTNYCREFLKSHTAGAPGYALHANGNVTGSDCVPHALAPDQQGPFPPTPNRLFSNCPLGVHCKPNCAQSERFWRPAPHLCGHKSEVCSQACFDAMMTKPRVCSRCADALTAALHIIFKNEAWSKRKPRFEHIARLIRSQSRQLVPEDTDDEESSGGEDSDDDELPPSPCPGPPPPVAKPTIKLSKAEAKARLQSLAK